MPPFDEDLDDFLDEEDFAHKGTYTPPGAAHPSASTRSVNLIRDAEFSEALGVSSNRPVAYAREYNEFEFRPEGRMTVDGKNYIVREVQPDGTGLIMLVLEQDG